MKHLVLLSGGMDSALVLHKACMKYGPGNVWAVTFDYNQLNREELTKSKELCVRYGCRWKLLEIPFYGALAAASGCGTVGGGTGDSKDVLLPHKNLVFISVACVFAESQGITSLSLGITKEDTERVWDASPSYLERLQGLTPITLYTPLSNMTKDEIAQQLHEVGVIIEQDTTSCYMGHRCGKCGSCKVALEARRNYESNYP